MGTIKITSWNVAHLDRLTKDSLDENDLKRRNAVVREIQELSPDVLCLLERPKGEEGIDRVSNDLLEGEWVAVKTSDGEYATQGNQWIWFFGAQEAQRPGFAPSCRGLGRVREWLVEC